MLLEKQIAADASVLLQGSREEAMIQQITIFLPGCSPGLWMQLKNDDLAFKWERG